MVTVKTTNSEKTIYFASLMSCSINKLKSHMLFTCKNFTKIFNVIRFNVEKKLLLLETVGGAGAPLLPPFSTALSVINILSK